MPIVLRREKGRRKSSFRFTICLLLILLFVVSLIRYVFEQGNMNQIFMRDSLFIYLGATLLFFYYIKRTQKLIPWISILVLFVISYSVVQFQLPLIHVLGFEMKNSYFQWFIWSNKSVPNKSVIISVLGMISFYIGYILLRRKNLDTDINQSRQSRQFALLRLNSYYWPILTICYLSYIGFIVTSGSYKYGVYSAGDEMAVSSYFSTVFNNCLLCAIGLRLYYINSLQLKTISFSKYISLMGVSLTMIVFWHLLFSFFVGDRGPIMMFGLMYFGLYFIRWKRITFLQMAVFFIVSSFVFSILSQVRTKTGKKDFATRVQSVLSDDSKRNTNFKGGVIPLSQTVELAFSVRCLNHVVANVPSKYDYHYGYFQMEQIVSSIPFLSGFYNKYVGKGHKKYDGSSNFITYLIQGDDPKYGDGRSSTADLYLDFGVYGVIVGLFLFGIFASRADFTLTYGGSVSLFFWLTALIYLTGAFYIGRSSILIFLQRIFQVYFFLLANHYLFEILGRNPKSIKTVNS